MRRALPLLLILLIALTGCSAAPRHHPPHPSAAPAGPPALTLAYPVTDPDPAQNVGDLYLPPARTGPRPLIVFFHGGGWHDRIGYHATASLAQHIAAKGFAVYNVEYRRTGSGGGWPTTLTDALAAARYGETLHERFPQISPVTYLAGHSAGGQLAVWVSGHLPDPPAGVVSISGPLAMAYAAGRGDRSVLGFLGGTPAQVPARYRYTDPAEQCPTVPIVAIQGTRDRVVPPAVLQAYRAATARCPGHRLRVVEVPGATHLSLLKPHHTGYPKMLDTLITSVRA